MAARASIKGSVFEALVEDVAKTVSDGTVSREELRHWLEPGDLAHLDNKIHVSSWYDIRSYERMNLLLRDVVGEGSNDYLRRKGRETARRLLESGLYAQLEFLHRTEVASATGSEARFSAFGRDLRKLASLSGSILNFSVWTSKPDPDEPKRYVIEVTEARGFPEVLCWRSDGFVNEMASQHGEGDLWAWEWAAPDVILFRMRRDL